MVLLKASEQSDLKLKWFLCDKRLSHKIMTSFSSMTCSALDEEFALQKLPSRVSIGPGAIATKWRVAHHYIQYYSKVSATVSIKTCSRLAFSPWVSNEFRGMNVEMRFVLTSGVNYVLLGPQANISNLYKVLHQKFYLGSKRTTQLLLANSTHAFKPFFFFFSSFLRLCPLKTFRISSVRKWSISRTSEGHTERSAAVFI